MDDFDTRRSGYVVVPREAAGGKVRSLKGLAARLADLVESPVMLVLASGLCLALLLAYNIYPDPPPELPDSAEESMAGPPGPSTPAAPASGLTVPPGPPPNEPLSVEGETFVVQVAAFRNPANAERLLASLREQDLDAKISVLATDLHAVELGPFAERSRADTAAHEVAALTGLSPLVVRTVP